MPHVSDDGKGNHLWNRCSRGRRDTIPAFVAIDANPGRYAVVAGRAEPESEPLPVVPSEPPDSYPLCCPPSVQRPERRKTISGPPALGSLDRVSSSAPYDQGLVGDVPIPPASRPLSPSDHALWSALEARLTQSSAPPSPLAENAPVASVAQASPAPAELGTRAEGSPLKWFDLLDDSAVRVPDAIAPPAFEKVETAEPRSKPGAVPVSEAKPDSVWDVGSQTAKRVELEMEDAASGSRPSDSALKALQALEALPAPSSFPDQEPSTLVSAGGSPRVHSWDRVVQRVRSERLAVAELLAEAGGAADALSESSPSTPPSRGRATPTPDSVVPSVRRATPTPDSVVPSVRRATPNPESTPAPASLRSGRHDWEAAARKAKAEAEAESVRGSARKNGPFSRRKAKDPVALYHARLGVDVFECLEFKS
jgi:hypothetical protein